MTLADALRARFRWLRLQLALATFVVISIIPGVARGLEPAPRAPAPALALPNAHRVTNALVRGLAGALPAASRAGLVGVYAAFDEAALDPYALIACDDDGDYAVVVSDAMLVLVDFVAQAAARDEAEGEDAGKTNGTRVAAYAAFFAAEQRHGARVVAPPAGFSSATRAHEEELTAARAERAFRAILASIVAHELAHAALGHITCAAPTATRERNDDVWSDAERVASLRAAAGVYSRERVLRAERSATWMLEAALEGDADAAFAGALAWLDFATRVEARGAAALVTYLRHHPASATRRALARETWDALASDRKSALESGRRE